MQESVLLFSMNDNILKQRIVKALLPLHLRLRTVDADSFGKTLAEIAGLKTAPGSPGSFSPAGDKLSSKTANSSGTANTPDTLPAPMIVFAGLNDAKLTIVLQALRAGKIVLPHKAVLTSANAEWTPAQLFAELEKERAAFSAGKTDH